MKIKILILFLLLSTTIQAKIIKYDVCYEGGTDIIYISDAQILTYEDLHEILYNLDGSSRYKEISILHVRYRQLKREFIAKNGEEFTEEVIKPVEIQKPLLYFGEEQEVKEIVKKKLTAKQRKVVNRESQYSSWSNEFGNLMYTANGDLRDPCPDDNLTAEQNYWFVAWFLFIVFVLWAGIGMNIHPFISVILVLIGIISTIIFLFITF